MTAFPVKVQAGFSVQEVLISIFVIGVAVGIGLPTLSPITEKAHEAKSRRNAQLLSGASAAAQAAGSDVLSNATNVPSAIATLLSDEVASELLPDVKSSLSGLTEEEIFQASRYLDLQNGFLNVKPEGAVDSSEGGNGDNNNNEEMNGRWHAQILASSFQVAVGTGHNELTVAPGLMTVIAMLANGLGSTQATGMEPLDQQAAAVFLEYANGTLSYTG